MDSTINETLQQVLFLAQYLGRSDPKTVIGAILLDLGFGSNQLAYFYLKIAIQLFHEDPSQLITYGLYPEVARRTGKYVTKYQVEIAIRRAIKAVWKNRSPSTWSLYFPSGLTQRKDGPSNTEFISGMADILELWEGCCKNIEACREVDQNEKE